MRYRSNNILTLISHCDDGKQILQQAMFFQRSLGMKIFIYHITDEPSFFEKIFHANRTKNIRADMLSKLRELAEQTIPADLLGKYTYRVKYGKTLPILLRQSKKGGYEFLIINKSGPDCALETAEIDKLISRSLCPVMSINKNHLVNEIKKIIIPVDISQTTQKKLLWATYFAKKYHAKIIIVSALSLNIETRQSLAWRNSEKLKHMLTQRGIECEVKIIKAKGKEKHDVILEYIENENPGLVIIRTHQESNLSNTQIGLFVSKIVHGCTVPVFTVNRFLHPMPIDFEL
jgi:nucleotide-binding universal stress UspA family protein